MPNIKKSTRPISSTEIVRNWHIVDFGHKVLGRGVTEIASLLQGKNKREYVAYLDMGDNVVVINAEKVQITGKKSSQKIYEKYSGYQGGRKTLSFNEVLARDPRRIIREAVSGMLPKNKHRDPRLSRLHIYNDDSHPFQDKFKAE